MAQGAADKEDLLLDSSSKELTSRSFMAVGDSLKSQEVWLRNVVLLAIG